MPLLFLNTRKDLGPTYEKICNIDEWNDTFLLYSEQDLGYAKHNLRVSENRRKEYRSNGVPFPEAEEEKLRFRQKNFYYNINKMRRCEIKAMLSCDMASKARRAEKLPPDEREKVFVALEQEYRSNVEEALRDIPDPNIWA